MNKILASILVLVLLGCSSSLTSPTMLRSKSDQARRVEVVESFFNRDSSFVFNSLPTEMKAVINGRILNEAELKEYAEKIGDKLSKNREQVLIQAWAWNLSRSKIQGENRYFEDLIIVVDVPLEKYLLKQSIFKELIFIRTESWVEDNRKEQILTIERMPLEACEFNEKGELLDNNMKADRITGTWENEIMGCTLKDLKKAKMFFEKGQKLYEKGLKIFNIETSEKLENYLEFFTGEWQRWQNKNLTKKPGQLAFKFTLNKVKGLSPHQILVVGIDFLLISR